MGFLRKSPRFLLRPHSAFSRKAHYDTFTLTEFPTPVNSKEPTQGKIGIFTNYFYF